MNSVLTVYDFMRCSWGHLEATKPWDTKGVEGVNRFLSKEAWRFLGDAEGNVKDTIQEDAELENKDARQSIAPNN